MIKIYALEVGGDSNLITDLYWFEEHGVHSFEDGKGDYGQQYIFKIVVDIADSLLEMYIPDPSKVIGG